MRISREIKPEGLLGREVFESKLARKLSKSEDAAKILPRGLFSPRAASPAISVDRMLGELGEMTAICDAYAA